MTTNMNVLGKLHILETLYRSGYQSEVIERAIDKLIALEQDRVRHELTELKTRLKAFEAQYLMSSEQFYRRYERGELGDSADFVEWSSFCDMSQLAQQNLDGLTGELP